MKKCVNGHYYADELDHCPYCPSDSEQENLNEKSEALSGDKTKIFGNDSNEDEGTKVFKDKHADNDFTAVGNSGDPDKTIISVPDEETGEKVTRAKKKLVGWLVSYTIDEMGMDFRLYEGKNVIGTNADCEITVPNDRSVSGKHATLLFRGETFMIKDEFSTNGTFINEKMLIDETPVLKDSDIIKVGNTIFKLKIAL